VTMQTKGFGYVVNQEFAGIQVIFAMGQFTLTPSRGGSATGEPPTPVGRSARPPCGGVTVAGGRAYARLDNGMGHNRAQPTSTQPGDFLCELSHRAPLIVSGWVEARICRWSPTLARRCLPQRHL
jgi:hypothetical protein